MEEKALSKEKDKTSQERLAEVRRERFAEEERLRKLTVRSPYSPALSPVLLFAPSVSGYRFSPILPFSVALSNGMPICQHSIV